MLLPIGTDALADHTGRNQILKLLSPADQTRIDRYLEPIDLPIRLQLEAPNKPVQHVCFIDHGIVSVVATGPRRQMIEVGVIGSEGYTGHSLILGASRSPLDTYVQVAGGGRRIEATKLFGLLDECLSLRELMHRSIHAFNLQVAFTGLANGRATLNQRLARWLLMAHDRVDGSEIRLTHEFLAVMLGVRRAGVTQALSALQKDGLVELKRGAVNLTSRSGLECLVDKFYGAPEAELKRMFPS